MIRRLALGHPFGARRRKDAQCRAYLRLVTIADHGTNAYAGQSDGEEADAGEHCATHDSHGITSGSEAGNSPSNSLRLRTPAGHPFGRDQRRWLDVDSWWCWWVETLDPPKYGGDVDRHAAVVVQRLKLLTVGVDGAREAVGVVNHASRRRITRVREGLPWPTVELELSVFELPRGGHEHLRMKTTDGARRRLLVFGDAIPEVRNDVTDELGAFGRFATDVERDQIPLKKSWLVLMTQPDTFDGVLAYGRLRQSSSLLFDGCF